LKRIFFGVDLGFTFHDFYESGEDLVDGLGVEDILESCFFEAVVEVALEIGDTFFCMFD
jgi:hypothetical protein